MVDQDLLTREDSARHYVESIQNRVAKNLVQMGLSQVKMLAGRKADEQNDERHARLPTQPFDLEFFARVLAAMASHPEIIRAVLDGKTPAEASGWDL